jgi:hypothetical protein
MANRYFQTTLRSFVHCLTLLQGRWAVGATGAVSSISGTGIKAITRLGAGLFLIEFTDPYVRFLNSHFTIVEPANGTPVADGSFVVGTAYKIITLGNTLWNAAGLTTGIIPKVGTPFVATTVGGTGTGTAAVSTPGLIQNMEVVGDPQMQINQEAYPSLLVRAIGPTSAGVTTPISIDPPNGSFVYFDILLRNSGVKGTGETQ